MYLSIYLLTKHKRFQRPFELFEGDVRLPNHSLTVRVEMSVY